MKFSRILAFKARESSPSLIFKARVPVPKVVASKVLVFVHGLVGEQPSDTAEESQDDNKEFGNPGRRRLRFCAETWSRLDRSLPQTSVDNIDVAI